MIYRFQTFTLDTDRFELRDEDKVLSVEPLVFDLLAYLVKHRDRVVGRDELLESLWSGKVVSDSALAARIRDVRRVLGDTGDRQGLIRTVRGRGFQFVSDVLGSDPDIGGSGPDHDDVPIDLSLPEEPSIGLIPFENRSGDASLDVFCDGLTDDINTVLSRLASLFVIARQSMRKYRGQQVDVRQIGEEQGILYVLDGHVHADRNRIRVSVTLVDTRTGRHQWAERYDRDRGEHLGVQDEIAAEVVSALSVRLTDGEQARIARAAPQNLDAWEKTHRARQLAEKHVREENFEANRLLRDALDLEPEYASAWAFLGWTEWENARWEWSEIPGDSLLAAENAARRALEIDAWNPDGLTLRSMLLIGRQAFDEATEIIERAVKRYPNHAFVLGMAAVVYRSRGRWADSRRYVLRAIRMSPCYAAWYLMVLGSLYFLERNYPAAIRILSEAAMREPESNLSRIWLLQPLVESGDLSAGRREMKAVREIDPEFDIETWVRSIPMQSRDESRRLRDNLEIIAGEST